MPIRPTLAVRDRVYWLQQPAAPWPALRGEVQADVAVVGGGMMGLMCALGLAQRGRSVVLVEAVTCGGGASGRSSGFITPDSELEYADLIARFGEAEAARLWRFAWGGVDGIRATARELALDCDLVTQDAVFVAAKPRAWKTVQQEHALRAAAGWPATLLSADALRVVLPAEDYHGGVRSGGTYGINGYAFCQGLRDRLRELGVRIYEQSRVTEVTAGRVTVASGGAVRADAIVLALDRFLPGLGVARHETYHAQTFLAITHPLTDAEVHAIFPDEPLMVWDTELIYHYFRLTGEQRLLVGGGTLPSTYARHEQHPTDGPARRLQDFLHHQFPAVNARLDACWPGLIGVSKDFAPILGRHPEAPNVWFAAAAAGLPWAAALGSYLAEQIQYGRNDFDEVLRHDRSYAVGSAVSALLGDPSSFALAHGFEKFVRG